MTKTNKAIESATYANLKERSAQMGERFDKEMFEQTRLENKEVFDEYIVQTKCAISAYLQHYLDAPELLVEVMENQDRFVNTKGVFDDAARELAKSILNAMMGELKDA